MQMNFKNIFKKSVKQLFPNTETIIEEAFKIGNKAIYSYILDIKATIIVFIPITWSIVVII